MGGKLESYHKCMCVCDIKKSNQERRSIIKMMMMFLNESIESNEALQGEETAVRINDVVMFFV